MGCLGGNSFVSLGLIDNIVAAVYAMANGTVALEFNHKRYLVCTVAVTPVSKIGGMVMKTLTLTLLSVLVLIVAGCRGPEPSLSPSSEAPSEASRPQLVIRSISPTPMSPIQEENAAYAAIRYRLDQIALSVEAQQLLEDYFDKCTTEAVKVDTTWGIQLNPGRASELAGLFYFMPDTGKTDTFTTYWIVHPDGTVTPSNGNAIRLEAELIRLSAK